MQQVFFRFLKLNAISDHPMIHYGLIALWITFLILTFFSIRNQPISQSAKLTWILVVLLLPVVGLAAYLFWCLFQVNWGVLGFILKSKTSVKTNLR